MRTSRNTHDIVWPFPDQSFKVQTNNQIDVKEKIISRKKICSDPIVRSYNNSNRMTVAYSLSKVEPKNENKTYDYVNCRIFYRQLGEDIWGRSSSQLIDSIS